MCIRRSTFLSPILLLSFLLSFSSASLVAQQFGGEEVITTSADRAVSVYATDLDGDGDADVLSASEFDDKIAWYENLGNGSFDSGRAITTSADGAYSVYATDLDGDGARSPGETDAALADSDGDGLPDGLERGLTAGTLDTDGSVFIADADPLTTTDPLAADTDAGGVPDGVEDHNRDGAVDTWETDPNDVQDEALAFYVSNLHPDQRVHFEVH